MQYICGIEEWLSIALYYRQLSADIKMKNLKIKTSFVRPKEPKEKNRNKSAVWYGYLISKC